jgi:O-antigen/teichoic acid export membrane protein
MILARLLTKADFGIAATFSLVITLFELSAKMGIARFVVQDKEGNEPAFISAIHLLLFCAAAVSGVLILVGAPMLAALFEIPEHAWALRMLAVVALCRGLEHADVRRYDRELRFGPAAWVEAVPQVLITLAAWPLATHFGDFRAVLTLLIAKSALSCVMSHLLAERPYAWVWRKDYALRMLRFGWPLVVNGFLMFGVLQGDQFLLATFYTMAELAPYAAAATLTMTPTLFFGGILGSVMLPLLSKVQDDRPAFLRRYKQVLTAVFAFSATVTVGLVIGGEALMKMVYGAKYVDSGIYMGWLAAANAFRNLRIAPSAAALARGDSQNQMISTLCRLAALPIVLGLALNHQPVWTLACCGLVGEALACGVSFLRLRKLDGIPLSTSLVPTLWLILLIALSGLLADTFNLYQRSVIVGLLAAIGAVICVAFVLVLTLPVLRREAMGAWEGFRHGGLRVAMSRLRGGRARQQPASP